VQDAFTATTDLENNAMTAKQVTVARRTSGACRATARCAGVLALLVAAACPAGTAQLTAMALDAGEGGAQLVMQLSGAASPRLFPLKGPDRAVIDFPDTQLAPGVEGPAPFGVVQAVRVGTQPGGVLRVVLQLSGAYAAHLYWGSGPHGRLLILSVGTPPVGEVVSSVAPAAATAPSEDTDPGPRGVRAAHAPVAGGRDIVVAVDAGHGGVDPGALGHDGTREKDVTLAIATRLAERINREPGMRSVLTRRTDEFVALRDRIHRARAAKADMFVSVHADAARNREASGASVYVLSEKGASNENARWLADHENAADLRGGVKLDDKDRTLAAVLLDLSQTATISASITAAQAVLASLDGVEEVRKSQVQQAGFVVLKSPDIPSMLVETAYISNADDERRLRRPAEQERLAEAIFAGVWRYFRSSPPEGTHLAASASGGPPSRAASP
jgi:N-acetylmuramoyl-L-alanine amidase